MATEMLEAVRTIPDYVPERTLGWQVIDWCSNYLQQPDGENAGSAWVFTQEQMAIVLRWYEIEAEGRFVYRRGVVRRLKGWGKDPLAAAIACAELCGPVRFGGWDADGQPVAVQHPKPWIQIAAVSMEQTRNTTSLFEGMFSRAAIERYGLDMGKTIIYSAGRGQMQAVTSSPKALEGARPSFIVAAETQNWLPSNDGYGMWAVIQRNLAKGRGGQARVLEINNAHLEGEESVAEKTYDAFRQSGGNVPGLYYDAVEAPEIDLDDPEALAAAIRVAMGDASWLDPVRLAAEVMDPTTTISDARRFYLNQPMSMLGERWMRDEVWDALADDDPIAEGADVVLGFDGSFSGDSTGIVVCSIEESPRLEVWSCWEPDPTDPDWRVPIEDVEDALREAAKHFRVREISADAYRWQRSLQVLAKERLPVVEFPQNPSRMIPATTTFMDSAVDKMMRHSGDERLRRHVLNAVAKTTSRGTQVTKDRESSARKIDLCVCAIMAFERAIFYQRRSPTVVSPWEVLSGEDGVDAGSIVEQMRKEYEELQREADEERKAMERYLKGEDVSDS